MPARLTEGSFELAFRGLLGEETPLSEAKMWQRRQGLTQDVEAWGRRSLKDRKVLHAWASGIYVKAGLGEDKADVLMIIGAMRRGTKEVLAIEWGCRESIEFCTALHRVLTT